MLSTLNATAKGLDLLLMPGQVISGHAQFEEACDNCHETLNRQNQSHLCLNCHDHKNIAKDIKNKQGYHGQIGNIANTSCSYCHTDHEGRDARIVLFDPESFDHLATDFELDGAHVGIQCNTCHLPKKQYFEAPGKCIDCHKKDDPHKGRLGENCTDCHTTKNWSKNQFDHDKTEFKLEGKHSQIDCKLCHAGETYKKTPKDCVACHQINDVHENRYGEKCETCHSTKEWKQVQFEHDKDTKFRLDKRHKKVLCDTCHTAPLYEKKPGKSCYSCHRLNDEHKGQNGKECNKCHTSSSWSKVEFSHKEDAKYPLKGRHKNLACESCHQASSTQTELKTTCLSCHKKDDAHKGQEGESCEQCHNENGWSDQVFFDHDLTKFPLIGQHSPVSCEECHLSSAFQDIEKGCIDCHEEQDSHENRLGQLCADCHTPNGWDFWFFDHDKQTEFPLEGDHENLICRACHINPVSDESSLGKTCFSCHRNDDVHRSGFGRRCERCHTSKSFKEIRPDRLRPSLSPNNE